jgi:protoporphyrinogen/coproporphyrinogen III oxidase
VGAAPKVIVCGAGLTGLTTAWELVRRGYDVTVLEAEGSVGGVVRTTQRDGYLVEHGPNSCMLTSELAHLIDALDLTKSLRQAAPHAQRRFIVRNGQPIVVPTSPPAMLRSRLFTLRAKLRILAEPFVSRRTISDDESVGAFVRRRLGAEPLTWAVDPFVSGVYAGDPEQLSVRHAFPRLASLEREHGSLLRGAIAMGKRNRLAAADAPTSSGAKMISFARGLQMLPDAIARDLGAPRLSLNTRVVAIQRTDDRVNVDVVRNGATARLTADIVVSTLTLHALQQIHLARATAAALAQLASVPYPAVASLALGFRRDSVAHALDGFGCLIPSAEQRSTLGVLFSSTLFENRAPDGHVLLTCFLGGVKHPELGNADTSTLLSRVLPELAALLGVRGAPSFVQHTRWPHAIPQFNVGYDANIDAAQTVESAIPGLIVDGQFRRGVSVGDCIGAGAVIAERVAALRSSQLVGVLYAPAPGADQISALPPLAVG